MKRTALWRIREKFRHEKRPLLKEAFNQVTSSSKFVYSLRSLLSKYTQNQNTSFKEPNPPTFCSSNLRYAARILQRKQKNPFILICNVPVLQGGTTCSRYGGCEIARTTGAKMCFCKSSRNEVRIFAQMELHFRLPRYFLLLLYHRILKLVMVVPVVPSRICCT